MSFDVGDIVEISGFNGLLWEVVEQSFYEHNSTRACVRVVYWGCPPEVKLDNHALDRLKNIEVSRPYRVEIDMLRDPMNAMMVIAIAAMDPALTGKGRTPWMSDNS